MSVVDHTNNQIRKHDHLLVHIDGGCEPKNPGGTATSGWVIYASNQHILAEEGKVVQEGGDLATNNYGEYSALNLVLKWLLEQKWEGSLTIKADSKLLVEQVLGNWKCKAPHLKNLRDEAWRLFKELNLCTTEIGNCEILWVSRDDNEYANDLCRKAYQEYKYA